MDHVRRFPSKGIRQPEYGKPLGVGLFSASGYIDVGTNESYISLSFVRREKNTDEGREKEKIERGPWYFYWPGNSASHWTLLSTYIRDGGGWMHRGRQL